MALRAFDSELGQNFQPPVMLVLKLSMFPQNISGIGYGIAVTYIRSSTCIGIFFSCSLLVSFFLSHSFDVYL